jgi:hypothetical protein
LKVACHVSPKLAEELFTAPAIPPATQIPAKVFAPLNLTLAVGRAFHPGVARNA